ncbi:MAG: hypothetical protein Q8L05_06480, partial [Actinomycetota bacterium]|nr:hypothetical protein [Actinomycetota bacterium]
MTGSPGFNDPAQDDDFRALFRPAEAASEPTPPLEPTPEPEAPRLPATSSGTGRLFRSRGAAADSDTLVALSASEAAQLRTMTLQSESPVAVAAEADPIAPRAAPVIVASPGQIPEELAEMAQRQRQEPGLTPSAVYVIVIGATLIAGLIDSIVSGAGLGWITGVGFLLSSIYCAVRVRASEVTVSVIAPPIAFGIAAITVGQLGQSRAG